MIRDGREIEDGGLVRAQVCIVGSGPAGLTVAGELARRGAQVVVLESGGEQPDRQIQQLAEATIVGDPLLDTSAVRHRRIGGNANAWSIKMADGRIGVRYAALHAGDFERRDWIPDSGWPFGLAELTPHYVRAQQTCEAGPFAYDAAAWVRGGVGPWPLDADVAEPRVFQFGPSTAFTEAARGTIERDPRSMLIHHATAVRLELDEPGTAIGAVRCRHFDGREFAIEAELVVVAKGGLANARLLLQSNDRRPAGVGNGHDLVGRYLQDHPLVAGGELRLSRSRLWSQSAFYDMRAIDGTSVLGYHTLAPAAQREHRLPAQSVVFFPRPSGRRSAGLDAIKHLNEAWTSNRITESPWRIAARIAAGADFLPIAAYRKLRWGQSLYPGFGRGGWSTMPDLDRKFTRFEVVHQAEQTPERSNRVLLGSDRDALGCPKLRVEWRFSADDSAAAARARRVFATEVARAGIGTITLPDDGDLPAHGTAAGTAHHIGTTRMHDDPRRGVTDRYGRVHELSNLFVAGSSLFPTGGYANPTLTIVALAHRVADHVAERLGLAARRETGRRS